MWMSARARTATRSAGEVAAALRGIARAAGRRRVRGARRSQQRRAETGADPLLRRGYPQAHGDHQRVHGQVAGDCRRSRRGPLRTGSQGRTAHRARSRAGQPAGDLHERCRAGLARRVRRRRSRRLGGSGRRVARRRGAPASGGPRHRRQHRAPADRGDRHRHDGAARADRDHHDRQGTGADPAPRRQAHGHGLGERRRARCRRGHRRCHEDRERHRFPGGLRPVAGWRLARSGRDVQRDDYRALHGYRRHVPGAGHAVRLVHRAAAGDDVAAAVADRRRAGAAR